MDLKPTRGTRDFFPEDMRFRSWLFDHFRTVAHMYGYQEYDAPVVTVVIQLIPQRMVIQLILQSHQKVRKVRAAFILMRF